MAANAQAARHSIRLHSEPGTGINLARRRLVPHGDVMQTKARVLIVEDDAVLSRGLARMFPPAQFDVTQAADGKQAVDLISRSRLDLIICDFRLPRLDGLRVLSHLRTSQGATPFILVTAHHSHELAREAKDLGAIAVFEKPIELNQLVAACEECLGKPLRAKQQEEQ